MSKKAFLLLTGIAVAVLLVLGSPAHAGKIVHRVSVGSSDIDPAVTGVQDANYSLIATMDDAGAVKGEYHDQFAGGEGVHIDVTALAIYPGGVAVVGGVIKNSTTSQLGYQVGDPVCTFVMDDDVNGDRISFTYPAPFAACNAANPFSFLEPIRSGQVKVR